MASPENYIEVDGAECFQPPVENVRTERPVSSDFTDNTYKNYVHLMPEEFQEENIDAIIICSPEDHQAAKSFEYHLANDISIRFGNRYMTPRVKLLDDIRGNGNDFLEKLFARTTYIFLFLTKSFCEEQWTLLISHACLFNTLNDPYKKWSVIPVHTLQKGSRNYRLPFLLNAVKPIEYLRVDQFYKESIVSMFSRKASERWRREVKLNEKRKEYFNQNKCFLFKMAAASYQTSDDTRDITLHGSRSSTSMHALHQEGQKKRNEDTISQPTPEIEIDGPVTCRGSRRNIHTYSNAGNNINTNLLPPLFSSDELSGNVSSSFNQSLSMNDPAKNSAATASCSSSQKNSSCVGGMNSDSFSSSHFAEPGSSSFNSRQKISPSAEETVAYTDSFPSKHSDLNSFPPSVWRTNISSSDVLNSQQDTTSSQPNIVHHHYYHYFIEKAENVAIGKEASINVHKEKDELSGSCESDANFPDQNEDDTDGLVMGSSPSTVVESGRQILVPPDSNNSFTAGQGVMREGFPDMMDPMSLETTTVNESESGLNPVDETFVKRIQ